MASLGFTRVAMLTDHRQCPSDLSKSALESMRHAWRGTNELQGSIDFLNAAMRDTSDDKRARCDASLPRMLYLTVSLSPIETVRCPEVAAANKRVFRTFKRKAKQELDDRRHHIHTWTTMCSSKVRGYVQTGSFLTGMAAGGNVTPLIYGNRLLEHLADAEARAWLSPPRSGDYTVLATVLLSTCAG
ncbi:uncharacterized protein MYCGRDRAFT_109708 [Zymoseptoria tritici IPO323]|uniref:Uncharacterized protein n=1 Tax=Zymoseptoria tritici (strain CBS 115943 / IPO323) TaxID=336722 RepID=F9XEB3_ZYMTI|nr:uncharacterized protein MYCGRDRAFT_109708 [Zymoseptoria tritici IPO323]EGP86315.1 hypothetical protein MYCGRDRAFT_109708 [Zymoseptoria tritici IPO323]